MKEARLTRTQLAQYLGVKLGTISDWKDSPPKYAIAFLEQYIELREYRQLKVTLKRAVNG